MRGRSRWVLDKSSFLLRLWLAGGLKGETLMAMPYRWSKIPRSWSTWQLPAAGNDSSGVSKSIRCVRSFLARDRIVVASFPSHKGVRMQIHLSLSYTLRFGFSSCHFRRVTSTRFSHPQILSEHHFAQDAQTSPMEILPAIVEYLDILFAHKVSRDLPPIPRFTGLWTSHSKHCAE
jgi:hypothetical protein